MSKRFFKLIAFFLLIIFWINFIYPINFVYADEEGATGYSSKREEQGITPSDTFVENQLFTGTTKLKQDRPPEPLGAGEAILTLIPSIFVTLGKTIAMAIDLILTSLTPKRVVAYPGTDMTDFINNKFYVTIFTLDKLFYGDINLLNANFFDFDSSKKDLNTLIKVNVARWNAIISGIALIMLLRSYDLFSNKYGFSLFWYDDTSKTCKY